MSVLMSMSRRTEKNKTRRETGRRDHVLLRGVHDGLDVFKHEVRLLGGHRPRVPALLDAARRRRGHLHAQRDLATPMMPSRTIDSNMPYMYGIRENWVVGEEVLS